MDDFLFCFILCSNGLQSARVGPTREHNKALVHSVLGMVLSPHFQEIPFKEKFQQLKHFQSLKPLLISVLKCFLEFLNSFLTMLKKTEAEFLENGSSVPHFCYGIQRCI